METLDVHYQLVYGLFVILFANIGSAWSAGVLLDGVFVLVRGFFRRMYEVIKVRVNSRQ